MIGNTVIIPSKVFKDIKEVADKKYLTVTAYVCMVLSQKVKKE